MTAAQGLPWIEVIPGAPYFREEAGAAWHPIGQNDSIDWPELAPLFRRRDVPAVERHLQWLKDSGVTVLRLMLEDARGRHRFIERPAGRFVPAMVQVWDDLFALCERIGLRVLLTPLDTFWMWNHWRHHPWNRANGGPLAGMDEALLCPQTRLAIKARLDFATQRWGGSGTLFAWDLWNEIHPANARDDRTTPAAAISDLSAHLRATEMRLHGRAHLQTVSLFGPELRWQGEEPLMEPIFRHPDLDFATIHIYGKGTIDDPADTIAPALAMGAIVRDCLAQTPAARPFLDTEHGPIHRFKDRKKSLPEAFDDEYFRHMAWSHLASGGAGGGMRWPNRHPHVLTPGMRHAQDALGRFLPLIDWPTFRRQNLSGQALAPGHHVFACGDGQQAIAWLLRDQPPGADGRMPTDVPAAPARLSVPMTGGTVRVHEWDTSAGVLLRETVVQGDSGMLHHVTVPFRADLALALQPA